MIKNLLKYIKQRMLLFKSRDSLTYKNIRYVNWWNVDPSRYWFTQLIESCENNSKENFSLYSVFGPRRKVGEEFDGIKIFYSGENLEEFCDTKDCNRFFARLMKERIRRYGDYCCNDVDMSLGYGYQNGSNYCRLPLWIIERFSPCASEVEIKKELELITSKQLTSNRLNEAVLMCSHDDGGIRKQIVDEISKITHVSLPGKFMHNTGDVWVDNKIEYLTSFKFNICPENVDAAGYVSEKLFECLMAGCIPIYVGSKGTAEREILNQDRIIFWNVDGNNNVQLQLIKDLIENEDLYIEFLKQPIFVNGAEKAIYKMINDTRNHIVQAIENKQA